MQSLKTLLFAIPAVVMCASCTHDVALETTVHEDGTLEKIITLEKENNNFFPVGDWKKTFIPKQSKSDSVLLKKTGSALKGDSGKVKRIDYDLSMSEDGKFLSGGAGSISSEDSLTVFTKTFASAEDANAQLAVITDTTFAITSHFEKKFRWFYTYITYSETYHKLNKLKRNPEDYFTPEDYAFISRLPAEGQNISTADELHLEMLNNKIFEKYGEPALYDEFFDLAFIVVTTQPGIDSLKKHKKDFRGLVDKMNGSDDDKMLLAVIDSLNIPIDQTRLARLEEAQQKFWKKLSFISTASDAKFVHRINLPWKVVNTNADSVSGNALFWAPPTIKFLLNDYTLYGECRKLNGWAVLVSVLIIGFTGYLFVRKRT